ncbi:MAG: alpha/beta hydrolase, partial [Candidatus Hodarchaeota archaeon]
MKPKNKRMRRTTFTILFLSLFILGTILIFTTPNCVKSTYGLKTTTQDGVTIYFNVFEPRTSTGGKKKAIILGHGGMATKEFMKGYAIEFATAGFVAVAHDFRGHGQSMGELEREKLIYDVEAIKQYLEDRGDIDMQNLSILGYSMGGGPAWELVKQNTSVKCLIGIGTGMPSSLTDAVLSSNVSHPLNVLMIVARFDQAVTVSELKAGMGLRLTISPEDIDVNKIYGSFKENNASMIFLDDNSDHLLTAWDEDFIRTARNWLISTHPDVRAADENLYVNARFIFLIMQVVGG